MVFSGVLRTWWLRWGSSGFFPPGGLAKLIGVGLTVTGPGASNGLPLSATVTGRLSLRVAVALAAPCCHLGFRVSTDIQVVTQ
jgi:hypothetical protein